MIPKNQAEIFPKSFVEKRFSKFGTSACEVAAVCIFFSQ
jgi:hypothetical protein